MDLHHRSDKALQELVKMYNPYIQGGSTTTATSIGRSCVRLCRGSIPMSSAGRAVNSSGCVTNRKECEIGLRSCFVQIRSSSLTGSYVMATAEQQERYESRGSRTVAGEPGGESPPGHSSKTEVASSLRRHWHGKKRPASRPTFLFTNAGPRREEVAPGPTRVRRKSERERAEYAREGEVLIDSDTPEDTEDRATQLRRGTGRQRLRIQSADNFVKLGASQSDRMFVVRHGPAALFG